MHIPLQGKQSVEELPSVVILDFGVSLVEDWCFSCIEFLLRKSMKQVARVFRKIHRYLTDSILRTLLRTCALTTVNIGMVGTCHDCHPCLNSPIPSSGYRTGGGGTRRSRTCASSFRVSTGGASAWCSPGATSLWLTRKTGTMSVHGSGTDELCISWNRSGLNLKGTQLVCMRCDDMIEKVGARNLTEYLRHFIENTADISWPSLPVSSGFCNLCPYSARDKICDAYEIQQKLVPRHGMVWSPGLGHYNESKKSRPWRNPLQRSSLHSCVDVSNIVE